MLSPSQTMDRTLLGFPTIRTAKCVCRARLWPTAQSGGRLVGPAGRPYPGSSFLLGGCSANRHYLPPAARAVSW